MEKDKRCDEESVAFNAIVHEDEMVISIAEYTRLKERQTKSDEIIINVEEYQNLKKEIEYLNSKSDEQFNLRQKIRDENMALREENSILKKENTTLKKGIIKFVKLIGGLAND